MSNARSTLNTRRGRSPKYVGHAVREHCGKTWYRHADVMYHATFFPKLAVSDRVGQGVMSWTISWTAVAYMRKLKSPRILKRDYPPPNNTTGKPNGIWTNLPTERPRLVKCPCPISSWHTYQSVLDNRNWQRKAYSTDEHTFAAFSFTHRDYVVQQLKLPNSTMQLQSHPVDMSNVWTF